MRPSCESRRSTSSRRFTVLLLGCLALAALVFTVPGAAGKPAGGEPNGKHVDATISLWLGTGVKYKVTTFQTSCVENVTTPEDKTKKDREDITLSFDATNGLFDGCLTSPSWARFKLEVTDPWKGQITFRLGNGQAGADYAAVCERWSLEFGLWCHKTGGLNLVVAKLN